MTTSKAIIEVTDRISEKQLVALVQAGLPYDTRFYEELVSRYIPGLRLYCSRMLKNHAEGEDATQEVLIKVLTSLSTFKWRQSFRAWIYTIAHNECIDRIRRNKPGDNLDEHIELDYDNSESANRDVESVLKIILPQLSVVDRDLLSLRHLAGLNFSEIAETMGMNLSAAKMRYKRIVESINSIVDLK